MFFHSGGTSIGAGGGRPASTLQTGDKLLITGMLMGVIRVYVERVVLVANRKPAYRELAAVHYTKSDFTRGIGLRDITMAENLAEVAQNARS
jgi:hypothetical protein